MPAADLKIHLADCNLTLRRSQPGATVTPGASRSESLSPTTKGTAAVPPTYQASTAFGTETAVERDFLRSVFAWMFLALALTTGIAIWFHQSDATLNFFARHTALFYVALFGQLGLVVVLSGVLNSQRISVRLAALCSSSTPG